MERIHQRGKPVESPPEEIAETHPWQWQLADPQWPVDHLLPDLQLFAGPAMLQQLLAGADWS